ncbi:lectin-like domain-containing protein, partial [Staphylococcus piscifermentans]
MKKMDFLPNLRNKYSIRRFTVGTASILIGSLLFLSHNGEAKAAENINDNTVVEASIDTSASQQALVEDNNTPQEKTAEVLQQQTDDKVQTQNGVEEVDNSAQPAKEVEQETTIQPTVEKDKETEQITAQKEDSVQPQKTENSKESVAEIADKATETTSTEAESLKEEAKVEKTQTPVVESKETKEVAPEAATQTTQSSTEPIVEKPVVAPSTPALSPQQKVEKVKEDLSKDYDNAAVDEVLATIDVSDLTPEQLKSEVLRILIEQAAAEKDLLSPQATLPRGKEESTGYATRSFDINVTADQEVEVNKNNFDEYFKENNAATYDSNSSIATLTQNQANNNGAISLDIKLNMSKDFHFTGAVNLGDKYEGHPKDGVSGGDGVAIILSPEKPHELGLLGSGFGIGNLPWAFGFKLDTSVNTAFDNTSKAYTDPDKFIGQGAFGAFIYANKDGEVITALGNNTPAEAALLNFQPNNQLIPLKVDYSSATKDMTVTYGNQSWTQNLATYITSAHKEAFAFSIVGSTGSAYNLQQVRLDEFRFTASAILEEYFVDEDTEELIDKPLRRAGEVNEDLPMQDYTDYLTEKGYELSETDDALAPGYNDIRNVVTLSNDAQYIVYKVKDIEDPTIGDIADVTTEPLKPIMPITLTINDNSHYIDSKTVTGLPEGLTFNETTNQITGIPTKPGTATVEVTASDAAGLSTTKSFTFTVSGAQAPTITPVSNQTSEAYSPITPITINANDSSNSTPTLTVAGLPTGLSFDPTTKQITGSPTSEGSFEVTITATDSSNNASTSKFDIIIQPNSALNALKATLADATTVIKDKYTPKSVEAFETQVTAGNTLANQPENGSNTQFTDASNAIKNAKNALVLRADKTGLNQSITTAEAIQPLQAGNALDDALKTALTKAKTVQADLNTDQPTVDAAKIDLDNAIKAKQAQTAQEAQEKQNALDELRTALTKAGGTNTAGYTTSSSNTFNNAVTNGQSILGTPGTKTTAEIKAATQALKDAQAGLVPQADKTALNTAINNASAYNNLNPNNPVDKALQDKLAVANTVKTNGDATPDQVKAATDDLNNAVKAKQAQDNQIAQDAAAKQAALNALNDALNKAKALDKSGYTPNSVTPLTEKETAAKAIADAPESKSTAEINTATQALKDAQAGLVPKADKNELQKALDAANSITGLEPTDKEDKAVQDAINTAQTVNQDDNASPQQVTEATKAINDAVSAKAHQDALDNLNKALDQAGKVDKADYTADSLKPFNKAAESGKTTAGDNTSTVEALNKAAKNVNDALAQLVPNKTKLDTAITNAKALAPLTDSNADQLLKNALNTAETVKNNPNATPAEIKTATTNLENEINNKKEADAINTLKSAVTKANGYNEAQYTPNTFGPLKTALTAGQNILDNPTTADTQATLAKANEIEQLAGALKERADKTELGKVLDKAIAYGNLNPNDAEDKALQDAVATGQRIDGDGNATTEEVVDTVKAINDAINAKDHQDALDELNKVIADAKTVHKEDYKPNTVTPLEDAVKAAETTKADASKSVEELKAAAKTITDAKNALQTKANKTELDKSVTIAENTGILDENDKEDKAVKDALDKAKTVQADQNATQEAVNTAKTELDNAVNAKNVQDTKDAQTKQEALDALKAELTKVKALDKTVYTPNTVATLTEKETAGNEIAAAPSTKTTAEINTATQALKDAQTALIQKADKTELQKALDKANTLTDLSATDKEDKAVQDAVTAANRVKSDDNATVEQVTNATKAITDAVAAKEHQDALDELNKAITESNTVQKADYKPKTVTTLETAVTAGETAKNDATKTVDELKAATKAIIDAKNALEPKADKTELQKALDKAKTLGELVATDKEDREVQEAVTVGNTVNEDDNAPAELVADTTKSINKAIAEKVHQDALDALQKAIDDANTVQKENYKPNTVAPFETAVTSGKTVKDDATKTVEELNAATKAIIDAKNALEVKADKTELDKSVETAEKLGKLDANDVEDKAVQEALDKAKIVQADHNTSQETVNTAKTELDNAVNAKKAQDTKEAVEKQYALDALKAELKKVQAINKELYTTNSVKELTNSEVSGQDVVTNATNKTTQEIETATKALKTAQANLVSKADKTELQKALNKAKTLGDLVATDKEDKAVQDAVAAGKSVNENNNATTEQVSNATKAINNAITAKEHQDALDELNKAIKEANAVTKDNYKPNTIKSLEEAVKAGETTREDTSKSVAELKAAAKTITEAQNKLEVKANKATLNKVVKSAKTLELNPSDKEDKSVQEALNTAKKVQADQNVSQETVDKATTELEKAVQNKTIQDKADKVNNALSVLKKELEKAGSIDKYAYTPNSVEPLTKAETSGRTIVNNSTGKTVEEITKATRNLKAAQKHLVEKADKVELDKVIDTAENTALNPNDKED